MTQVTSLNGSSFDGIIDGATSPVLVDFYASWCPPCRALAPVLDQLCVEFAGQIDFYKVNIDEEPELARRFEVSAVPTLALFAAGEQIYEINGFVPPAKLRAFHECVVRASAGVAKEP